MQMGALAKPEFPDPIGGATSLESSLAFKCLLFLIFIIYIAPQAIFPALQPLHLGKVSAFAAMVGYGLYVLQGHRLTVMYPEVKLVLWLVAFAVLSIPISKWPGGSFEAFTDLYSKSVIVFFLIANLLTSKARFGQVFWAIAIFTGFNAGVGIKDYLNGTFVSDRIPGAYSGITTNSNDLALSINLAIPFVGYLFVTSKARLLKLLTGGILVMSLACIVVTFSRGGFVTLLGLLLWFACTRKQAGLGSLILSLLLLMAGLAAIVIFGPEGYSERIASIVDSTKDSTGSATLRRDGMEGALRGLLDHPLGVGLNMNGLDFHESNLGWNGVHNVYLQIGSELGIVPGILFIVLLWKLLATMRKSRLSAPPNLARLAWAVEGSLVAFAVGAMFHPVAYHFFFYINAGLAVAFKSMASGSLESVHAFSIGGGRRTCAG